MKPRLPLLVCLAIFLLPAISPCSTADAAGLGGREKVDVDRPPWSSIGQVNNGAYGRCTGALIGPRLVVTAAHCLYNRATRQFMRPSSIHFVLGYDRGRYVFQSTAAAMSIGSGYDGAEPLKSIASDWALLTLKDAAPAKFAALAVAPEAPRRGRGFVSVGFAQDRPYVLTKTPPCTVEGISAERLIIGGCDVPKGYSGGPMIDPETRELIGMQVARFERDGLAHVVAILPATWQAAQP